jgi:hypothetical protein
MIMKTLLTALCVTLAFNVQAEDVYIPPTVLTNAEVRQAEIDMEKNRVAIRKHWQARLEVAQENERKMAELEPPLKKPRDAGVGRKH